MRIGLGVAAISLLFVACGGGGAATPQAAFEKFRSHLEAKDWDAVFEMASESVIKEIEEAKGEPMVAGLLGLEPDEVEAMEIREFFGKMMAKMAEIEADDFEKMVKGEFVKAEEEGDRATVTYKSGDDEEDIDFIKVDGRWMLASFD